MMKERIAELEARVAALEQRLQAAVPDPDRPSVLRAPLRVVDAQGRTVVEIASETNDNAIRIFNAAGQAVATLGADGTHAGYLALRNTSGRLVAYLDVETHGARLQLQGNEQDTGGLALFGGDADGSGGGINLIAAEGCGGLSLWTGRPSGQISIEDARGKERLIDAGEG